jgi:hypothetical protein
MTTYALLVKQAVDTAANWAFSNPVLLNGELGHESDTKKYKLGDGLTNWNDLVYSSVDWVDILNLPTEFPPTTHGHPWESISGPPATYPPSTHDHTNLTGLQVYLLILRLRHLAMLPAT